VSEEAPAGYIAPEGKTKVVKGDEGQFMKQESGKLVGEHMFKMMCPQRLARTVRPKQLFVHVGAHIIAPITAAALAFVLQQTHRSRHLGALFRLRLAPGIVLRSAFKVEGPG
jgi:hypothetical protein